MLTGKTATSTLEGSNSKGFNTDDTRSEAVDNVILHFQFPPIKIFL